MEQNGPKTERNEDLTSTTQKGHKEGHKDRDLYFSNK